MGTNGRQRVVDVGAEVLAQRFDGNAAVDGFFVDDGSETDDRAPVVVVPFVGCELDI